MTAIELFVAIGIGARIAVSVDGAAAMASAIALHCGLSDWAAPPVILLLELCESPACTEEYIKKSAPKPSPVSVNKDRTTILADASPAGNESRASAKSSTGCAGGGGGTNQRCWGV
ncbi:MAG: hypothetical protein WBY94_04315 [Polyangiaceae bacterium]